jgi:ribose 5-phosphate isomerase B
MRVILAADHGGFELKNKIKSWLVDKGYEITDVGAETLVPDDDYVDYAKAAVKEANFDEDKVILFCRNGLGMSIAANRFIGIRCGVAFDEEAVRKGRTDDDINCLSVPADYEDEEKVKRMVEVFLTTAFSDEQKYTRRVRKLEEILS